MRYSDWLEKHFDVHGGSGDERLVMCAFHGGRNPHMYVNVKRGLFICHSCGERGTIWQLAERIDVPLEDRGVPVSSLRNRLVCQRGPIALTEAHLPESYLVPFDIEHPYWTERGLEAPTIARFQLGYDLTQNRVTIPVRDSRGRLLGVIGRALDPDVKPKYKDPTGFAKGRCLFGSWLVRNEHNKVALVEGPMDAIACWDARIPALALMGARLTKDQRKLLLSLGVKTVVLFLDNDKPGRGWPNHHCDPRPSKGTVPYRCSVCLRPCKRSDRGNRHSSTGTHQVAEMLRRTGIRIKVAEYRSYWLRKDPGELNPQQRRKAFHSSIEFRDWVKDVSLPAQTG